jgi:colanic acid biosynthesis glycosyl transferase WcaI
MEEVTYALSAAAYSPFLASSDVAVAVSPSFLGAWAVATRARLRRLPWVLWLQDIIPDAAATTGLVAQPTLLALARRYERWLYSAASRIVAISETFTENLAAKGVDRKKVATIYNPATRPLRHSPRRASRPHRILSAGNIGLSQGLLEHVHAIEKSELDATLVIVGTGALEKELRRSVHSDRVQVMGLVDDATLARELEHATLALVTQKPGVIEFNVPSRLMNYMAEALPIVASVRPDSEIARIVSVSGGGWVVDCRRPERLLDTLRNALSDTAELARRGRSAATFASREFAVDRLAQRFDDVLWELVTGKSARLGEL